MPSKRNPKSKLPPIVLQFAMRLEADPLLEHYGLKKWKAIDPEFHFRHYTTRLASGRPLHIVLAGVEERHDVDAIGGLPASLLGYLAIRRLKPALVMNAGTCGGFASNGDRIAEVFCATGEATFHARRVSIPGLREHGLGHHPLADVRELARALGVRTARVTSGDSLDCSPEDLRAMQAQGATLKEMEAAPLAWVCEKLKVPLVAIKGVTDIVDHEHPSHEQFLINYRVTVESLTKKVIEALDWLDSHPNDPAWKTPKVPSTARR